MLATNSTSDCRFESEHRLPDPQDILTICSALASVTPAANQVIAVEDELITVGGEALRLTHFSVKEYLISDRLKKTSIHRYHITPLSANISIATTCLTYLLYFESPTILMEVGFEYEFSLTSYAAKFWPSQYRCITDDADRKTVDSLAFKLVKSTTFYFSNWRRILHYTRQVKPRHCHHFISSVLYDSSGCERSCSAASE